MIRSRIQTLNEDIRIRQAFSKAAKEYDSLTSLHRQTAQKIIDEIAVTGDNATVLDIGMGTGWLTERLKEKFSQAQIIGLDFAEGMIEFAKGHSEGIQLVLADARRLPFKKESFDLIVSNLAYQWVEDLPRAFCQVYQILKKEGYFYFSIFGEKTFCELFDSLEEASILKKEDVRRLTDMNKLKTGLASVEFREIFLQKEEMRMPFDDVLHLMRWIKGIGANRLHQGVILGREAIRRTADIYEKRYSAEGGISVTFEIFRGFVRK